MKLLQGKIIVDDDWYEMLKHVSWFIQKDNYVGIVTYTKGKWTKEYIHRIIMDVPKGKVVDHINSNPLDNRRCNLRICTQALNLRSNNYPKGRIPFRGVCLDRDKFKASISIEGKTKHIGMFPTAEEAAKAYDEIALRLFGKFAKPNFPKENYEVV